MNPIDNQEVLVHRLLEKQSNDLVDKAEKAIDDKMSKLRGRLRLGQFNNLLGVALETDSPRVVQNWLLYQMGRSDFNVKPWRESGLGEQVVKDIQSETSGSLLKTAEAIAKQAYESPTSSQIQDIHIVLVRRYIGYLKRWFVAKGGQE